MFEDFKEFAMKGNVLDMAVGVIMGASFGKVVGTFTDGIMMPPVGQLMGGVDFNNKFIDLTGKAAGKTLAQAKEAGLPVMSTGVLLTNIIDFLIVAAVLFLLVKAVNRMKAEAPAPPPPGPTKEQMLLTEIRDALVNRKGAAV